MQSSVSQPGIVCLLPASVKLQQAILLPSQKSKISDSSNFMTVLVRRMGCCQRRGFLKELFADWVSGSEKMLQGPVANALTHVVGEMQE